MGNVQEASPDDVDVVAAVLADAFTDDPLMVWAFPDAAARPRLLQGMFGFLAERAYVPQGQCTIAEDAAALWRPAGFTLEDEFWVQHGGTFAAALEGQLERITALGAAMEEHRPHDPHRYLLAIGVRPSAQGRGLGGEVLAYTLAQVDANHEAVYLEATTPRSRVLYERHGFEVTAEFTADGSPSLWAMWRAPR